MFLPKEHRSKLENMPAITIYPKLSDHRSLAKLYCYIFAIFLSHPFEIFDPKIAKFENFVLVHDTSAADSPERAGWCDAISPNNSKWICENCTTQKSTVFQEHQIQYCNMNKNDIHRKACQNNKTNFDAAKKLYGYTYRWVAITFEDAKIDDKVDWTQINGICPDHTFANFSKHACNDILSILPPSVCKFTPLLLAIYFFPVKILDFKS